MITRLHVRVAGIAAMALFTILLASPSYAQLLNLPRALPTIDFDSSGVTTYDPGTFRFDMTATAQNVCFKMGTPDPDFPDDPVTCDPAFFQPIVSSGHGSIAIRSYTDGLLIMGVGPGENDACGGTDGHDFCLQGSVLVPGESTPRTGILLTGEVWAFGSLDSGGPTDDFELEVAITGGSMADLYAPAGKEHTLTVKFGSEGSSFEGRFDVPFNGGAKGVVAMGNELQALPPPTPECTGQIGNFVWNDVNQNGIQDWFESGLGGVPVDLYMWSTTTSAWEIHTTGTNTDANGLYSFGNLCPGEYKVQPSTLEGYTPSPSNAPGSTPANDSNASDAIVTLAAYDSVDLTVDFGFYVAQTGAFTTVTQGGWGSKPAGNNPGMILKNNFSYVYPTSMFPLGVVIGDQAGGACPPSGPAPNRDNFTSASAVQAFLPQGSKPAALNACQQNPTKKVTVLAGQVLALRLNVDFSYTGVTQPGLGSLTAVSGPLAGKSVNDILAIGNCMLSGKTATVCLGTTSSLTLAQINDVITKINENFDGGTTNKGYLH